MLFYVIYVFSLFVIFSKNFQFITKYFCSQFSPQSRNSFPSLHLGSTWFIQFMNYLKKSKQRMPQNLHWFFVLAVAASVVRVLRIYCEYIYLTGCRKRISWRKKVRRKLCLSTFCEIFNSMGCNCHHKNKVYVGKLLDLTVLPYFCFSGYPTIDLLIHFWCLIWMVFRVRQSKMPEDWTEYFFL